MFVSGPWQTQTSQHNCKTFISCSHSRRLAVSQASRLGSSNSYSHRCRRRCFCQSHTSRHSFEAEAAAAQASSSHGTLPRAAQGSSANRFDASRPNVATFKASKQHSQPVTEKERPLAEYMALPASQYSVLDAEKIERLDDSTFRCHVGRIGFFKFAVEPVLTVSVIVKPEGPVVKLLDTKLEGSKTVESANDRFEATMTNVVRWGGAASSSSKEISSNTAIQVALEVPSWFRIIPIGAIEDTGNRVMQAVLNRMVPRFLKQLQADYELWASGDDSRKPIGDGKL